MDVALFSKAKPCAMHQIPACHQHETKSCCEDESIVHDGQDFKVSSSEISFSSFSALEIELPGILIAEIIPTAPIAQVLYQQYDPPLRSLDLTLSLRVFLI